jgi:PBSX family phage terminase large subunit
LKLQPFSPKQLDTIVGRKAKVNLWHGSVRSTKTTTSILAWIDFIANDRPDDGDLVMTAKTNDTLRRNVLYPMQSMFVGDDLILRESKREAELWGNLIHLIGANDEKAEMKIRGITAGGMYGDEVSTWPESYWNMAMSRLSPRGSKFFGTTNPDNPRHWLKKNLIDRADLLDVRIDHFTLDDNGALDPEFKRNLGLMYGGPGNLYYDRFILGKWVVAEGLIYSMLQEHHRGPWKLSDETLLERVLAIDYGTANPFVCLMLEVHELPDGFQRIFVTDEYRWDSRKEKRQLTDADYSTALAIWLNGRGYDKLVIDPSATSMANQLYHDAFHGVELAENAVDDGIRVTTSLISTNRLNFIEGPTDETWDEMQGYVWDPKKSLIGQDVPLKQDDHGPDALRYGCMALRRWWRQWIIGAVGEGA